MIPTEMTLVDILTLYSIATLKKMWTHVNLQYYLLHKNSVKHEV